MSVKIKIDSFLYERIIEDISKRISNGILKAGDKLPSVRKLSNDFSVSVSTVIQSYVLLEGLGLIEAKPQSGYYVRYNPGRKLPEPQTLNVQTAIKNYGSDELVSNLCEIANIPNLVSLGAGIPSTSHLPVEKLGSILRKLSNVESGGLKYEFPPGYRKLREEIAKRLVEIGINHSVDEIIITNGATEALTISLQAIAKPGDTIITECPTYHGVLQIIQNLGMNILEVPTHPKDGVDVEALKKILRNYKVAASVLYPTISNPLGSIMPEENKKEAYNLFASKNIPIIEGDVYGELYFGAKRPRPIKSLDDKGLVLYSSSFSKTIAPGYRIGWVSPGKYYEKVKKMKLMNSLATATLPQMVIAEYLKDGGYERTLRNLRKKYASNISLISGLVSDSFPEGTKISRPEGGFYLWVELPKQVNSIKLQRVALKENISIAPGPLFSTKDCYMNFIRLSCGCSWSLVIEKVIKRLGELCKEQM